MGRALLGGGRLDAEYGNGLLCSSIKQLHVSYHIQLPPQNVSLFFLPLFHPTCRIDPLDHGWLLSKKGYKC